MFTFVYGVTKSNKEKDERPPSRAAFNKVKFHNLLEIFIIFFFLDLMIITRLRIRDNLKNN